MDDLLLLQKEDQEINTLRAELSKLDNLTVYLQQDDIKIVELPVFFDIITEYMPEMECSIFRAASIVECVTIE